MIHDVLGQGRSVSGLAAEVGCSRMQLWRIMNGKCPESSAVARRLRRHLELTGSTVVTASELEEAVKRLARETPERSRIMLQMLQLMLTLK
jgi:transposase-like protein